MSYKESLVALKPQVKDFNAAIGETAQDFGAIAKSLHGDGALTHKQKELVALGIAVAIRCEPCIMFHIEALVRLGATRQEIAETLAVCVEMGGGPCVMYGTKALAAFDEFNAKSKSAE
ncbi:carboxymuconolactone decarboxylase family protein [Mameliella sp.]|uniref:carboxymuconolactone decarboxylase family protein n=1 Tax=Mameliella sp. TaxID=1924940 RepID=UPI003BA984DC